RPATRRRLGRPLPHQQADRPRGPPEAETHFLTRPCDPVRASGISHPFWRLSRSSGQVPHVLLTRSPLGLPRCCHRMDLVRLACVRHAASVRPEPGSNSPSRPQGPPPRWWARRSVEEPAIPSALRSFLPTGTRTGTTDVVVRLNGAFILDDISGLGGRASSLAAVARTRSFVLSSVFKERRPSLSAGAPSALGGCASGGAGAPLRRSYRLRGAREQSRGSPRGRQLGPVWQWSRQPSADATGAARSSAAQLRRPRRSRIQRPCRSCSDR